MNYKNEIETAIQISSGLLPGSREAEKFVDILAKQGLCICPIPQKQVHDVERLILAERIVATRRKIQTLRASEIFENHGAMVKELDEAVQEYFAKYSMEIPTVEMEAQYHD